MESPDLRNQLELKPRRPRGIDEDWGNALVVFRFEKQDRWAVHALRIVFSNDPAIADEVGCGSVRYAYARADRKERYDGNQRLDND